MYVEYQFKRQQICLRKYLLQDNRIVYGTVIMCIIVCTSINKAAEVHPYIQYDHRKPVTLMLLSQSHLMIGLNNFFFALLQRINA